MGLLVLMSLASWTIWIQKTLHLGRVKRRTQIFQKTFWKGTDWQVLQENKLSTGKTPPDVCSPPLWRNGTSP